MLFGWKDQEWKAAFPKSALPTTVQAASLSWDFRISVMAPSQGSGKPWKLNLESGFLGGSTLIVRYWNQVKTGSPKAHPYHVLPWLFQPTRSVKGEVECNEHLAENLVGWTEAEERSILDGNLRLHLESAETHGAENLNLETLSRTHLQHHAISVWIFTSHNPRGFFCPFCGHMSPCLCIY